MNYPTHITHAVYVMREGADEPIAAKFTVAAPPGHQRTFTVINREVLSGLYALSKDPTEFCNFPVQAIYRRKRIVHLEYDAMIIMGALEGIADAFTGMNHHLDGMMASLDSFVRTLEEDDAEEAITDAERRLGGTYPPTPH